MEQCGSRLSFGLLIFLAVLIQILIIAAIIVRKQRMTIYSCFKTCLETYISKQKIETEDKMERVVAIPQLYPNLESVQAPNGPQTSVFTFSSN